MVKRKSRERKGPRTKDNTDRHEQGTCFLQLRSASQLPRPLTLAPPLGTEWSVWGFNRGYIIFKANEEWGIMN